MYQCESKNSYTYLTQKRGCMTSNISLHVCLTDILDGELIQMSLTRKRSVTIFIAFIRQKYLHHTESVAGKDDMGKSFC